MKSEPTIVLVPGAWSPPDIYSELQSNLSARGIHSETVQHPSTGAEPATKTLEDDVSHLRHTLVALFNAGKSIVIVAHSYGGVVASAAVKGLEKSTQHSEDNCGGVLMKIYSCLCCPRREKSVGCDGWPASPVGSNRGIIIQISVLNHGLIISS